MRSSHIRRCANSRNGKGAARLRFYSARRSVKAQGNLSTALADAKADLAKAEATVESMVTAAKKAV